MSTFTLLCHNVFWFQGSSFESDQPPEAKADILESVCLLYESLRPDVICLQEIQTRQVFDLLSLRLDMEGIWSPGQNLPQYGGAVLWKPGIGRLHQTSLSSPSKAQRVWQIVDVELPHISLRIANAHLPSSRQLGSERSAIQRTEEMKEILQRAPEQKPDIIAGDFNEWPGSAVSLILHKEAYQDLAALTGQGSAPTNLGTQRGDYIWAGARLTKKTPKYGVIPKAAIAIQGKKDEYLSDHLLIWASWEQT